MVIPYAAGSPSQIRLRPKHVCERLGDDKPIAMSTLYQWIKNGLWPRPHKMPTGGAYWYLSEVEAAEKALFAEPRQVEQ